MKSFPNLARNTQKGFTLIEVLIVVIVLGLISAIAVPAFNNSIERAASVKLIESVTDNIADATRSLLVTTGVAANVETSVIPKDSNNLLDVLVEGKEYVEGVYQNDYEDASITKLNRQIEVVTQPVAETSAGVYKVNGYVMTYTSEDEGVGRVTFAGVPAEVAERIEQARDGSAQDGVTAETAGKVRSVAADGGLIDLTLIFDL